MIINITSLLIGAAGAKKWALFLGVTAIFDLSFTLDKPEKIFAVP